MPGSIPVTIPAPQVDYPVWVDWPAMNILAAAAAFPLSGVTRYSQAVTTVFNAKIGVATANTVVYKGLPCGQYVSDGIGNIAGFNTAGLQQFAVPLTKNAVAATFAQPEIYRVFRVQFLMAQRAAVAYSTSSGYVLQCTGNGAVPGWIGAPGQNGFGIVGDGAGGWNYISKQGAGITETVALAWPASVAEWCLVDFEILGATGASDAVFNLYLNGTLKLSRLWGAGSLLPDYSLNALFSGIAFATQCGEAALAGNLCLGSLLFMQGRYRVNGAQV